MHSELGGFLSGAMWQSGEAHNYGDYEYELMEDHQSSIQASKNEDYDLYDHGHPDECPW